MATVTDLGRFLRAQLNGGRTEVGQVLTPATVATMQQRQFGHHPGLAGLALGFHERYHGGNRVLEHGGDGPGSHSLLALVPEPGDGISVAFNGDGVAGGGAAAAREVVTEFLARFHPAGDAPHGPGATALASGAAAADLPLEALAGTYRSSRVSHHDFTSFQVFFASVVQVEVVGDGTLRTTGLGVDPAATQLWEPVGGLLFRAAGGADLIAFGEREGQVVALFDGPLGYEKLAWYESPQLHLAVAVAVAVVGFLLLLSCLGWLWPAFRVSWRQRGQRRPEPHPPGARVARWLAFVTTALVLGFLGALLALLTGDIEALVVTRAPMLPVAFGLLQGAAVTAVAVVGCAVLAWWRGWWGRWARLHYTASALGAVLLFGVFHTYHFLLTPLG